jgi:hypothetical protein
MVSVALAQMGSQVCVINQSISKYCYVFFPLYFFSRLQILGSRETYRMTVSMFLMVGRSQSSGRHQRHCITTDTPPPAKSGVTAVSSMRYGHWELNHFKIFLILRY